MNRVFFVVFLMYVVFMVFGVLNVLTGVFVNVTVAAAHEDSATRIATQLEEKDSWVNKIGEFFKQYSGKNDTITVDQFHELIQQEEVIAYFEALDIDSNEAHGLFELLD